MDSKRHILGKCANKKKKEYIAPNIGVHSLDQEICLVMASFPDPEIPPSLAAPSKMKSESVVFEQSENTSPFGGDLPDYK